MPWRANFAPTGGPRRLWHRALVAAPALALAPAWAAAHTGPAPVTPDRLWSAWNLDPLILTGVALGGWVYGRGVAELWRRAGSKRAVAPWRVACFGAGLGVLVASLTSPLDRLGHALFAAHMAQHLLLILVAAPLLVLGAPLAPVVWALPAGWRHRIGRWRRRTHRPWLAWLGAPLVAWAAHSAALWVWHLPALYEGALGSDGVHALEHASFFATALLFWWVVAHAGPRRRFGLGTAILAVFTMGAQGTVLGAFIALASTPWYASHAASAAGWGLTPLEDQQLAGLVMWMPAGLVYLAAGLLLFARWMRAGDQPVSARESVRLEVAPR